MVPAVALALLVVWSPDGSSALAEAVNSCGSFELAGTQATKRSGSCDPRYGGSPVILRGQGDG